jgi:hypothetical protein
MFAAEMGLSVMISLQNFMNIGIVVQVILRICFRNLKGYFAGIIDERVL